MCLNTNSLPQAGEFASGVAQVQSQYNPVNTAHSEGARIVVK